MKKNRTKCVKYYFPLHYDGGNRGCEAIAKSTAMLLGVGNEDAIAYCRNVEQDTRLGLADYVRLIPCSLQSKIIDKCLGALNLIFHTTWTIRNRMLYPYRTFLNMIGKDDVMISTGGDMMCYGDNEVIYTNNLLHAKGIKTVLWGCSMGRENLTKEKEKSLCKFSLIYTRESLSYEFFQSLGLKNVCLFPDPAFILQEEVCEIPECFSKGDVVGINVSNYVAGGMTLDSTFGNEIKKLISFILEHTDLHILLVPHVTWRFRDQNQDDREMAKIIKDTFSNNDRISILNIDDKNYCQIRYVIGQCQMFIGARTHAVISAYSMCVPSIALGYSIKSRGIAKDLGISDKLVVDSKYVSEGQIVDAFIYMMKNAEAIREQLKQIMPDYKNSTYGIREYLNKI